MLEWKRDESYFHYTLGVYAPVHRRFIGTVDMDQNDLPTPRNIAKRRDEFSKFSEHELMEMRGKFSAGSASGIAAARLLATKERHRFHWIFWPALAAAIASIVAAIEGFFSGP